jgi:hypothetical protein
MEQGQEGGAPQGGGCSLALASHLRSSAASRQSVRKPTTMKGSHRVESSSSGVSLERGQGGGRIPSMAGGGRLQAPKT